MDYNILLIMFDFINKNRFGAFFTYNKVCVVSGFMTVEEGRAKKMKFVLDSRQTCTDMPMAVMVVCRYGQ
jgi:hypothetical protein